MREVRFSMRVWDLPTRLVHAGAIAATAALLATPPAGVPHLRADEALLAIVLFRLGWGFAGSETARWRAYARSPLPSRSAAPDFGHAAAGGWLVPILVLVLLGAALCGLASGPDGQAPLGHRLDPAAQAGVLQWHHWLILAAVGGSVLHGLVLAAHRLVRSQPLAGPMITGRLRLPGHTRQPRRASPALAVALASLAALLTWVLATRL